MGDVTTDQPTGRPADPPPLDAAGDGRRSSDPWTTAAPLALAAALLGRALQVSNGMFAGPAFVWLGMAVLACAGAVFIPRLPTPAWMRGRAGAGVTAGFVLLAWLLAAVTRPGQLFEPIPWPAASAVAYWLALTGVAVVALKASSSFGRSPVMLVIGAAFVAYFIQLQSALPVPPGDLELGVRLRGASTDPFFIGITAVSVLAGALLSPRPWLGRALFPLIVACYLMLGAWAIRATPEPRIDVWVVQQEACRAVLHGENPYALTYRNIYPGEERLYPPGAVVDGRVQFGLPYMPVTVLLDLPGYLLGGDYRYSNLVAMALAALLIAHARPHPVAPLAAALLLFMPRSFFVLEQGWTEPHVILALAATVFCACRAPRLVPVALGVLWCSKQYLVMSLPLTLLLLPRPVRAATVWRWFCVAGAVGGALTLPLVLWDPERFVHSTLLGPGLTPFRDDALSFLALYKVLYGTQWPGAVGFVAGGVAAVGCALACRRSPAGFAAGVALTYLLFFALNKIAASNYFTFSLAAMCCAAAATNAPPADDAVAQQPPPPATDRPAAT